MNTIRDIFDNPPKEKHEIRMILDSARTSGDIFHTMIDLLKYGIALKHSKGNVVNIEKLTDHDMNHIQKYFNSFGIVLIWEIVAEDTHTEKLPENPKLNNYNAIIRLQNRTVKISFDFLPVASKYSLYANKNADILSSKK